MEETTDLLKHVQEKEDISPWTVFYLESRYQGAGNTEAMSNADAQIEYYNVSGYYNEDIEMFCLDILNERINLVSLRSE